MGPNNSMNPTNPANQPGDPNNQPITGPPAQPLGNQGMGGPKTIRDYIALARSQGQTPTFTNRDQGAGFDIRQDPSMIPDQAIQEEPVDDYESMPFTQRMRIDPYMRTKKRLKSLMPELFQQMFPGRTPQDLDGGDPNPKGAEHVAWSKEVEGLTGSLLKKHAKEYEWDRKNLNKSKTKRASDEQMWQKMYVQMVSSQRPPTDPNTGETMPVREFIDQQMSIADEKTFRDDMAQEEEIQQAKVGTIEDLDAGEISEILGEIPELAKIIRDEVVLALGQIIGNPNLTDAEFNDMRTDPQWKLTFDEEVRKAIMNNQESIMQFANGKPQAAQGAIPEESGAMVIRKPMPNGA